MTSERFTPKNLSVKIVTGVALGSIFLYSFSTSLINVTINEVVDGFSLVGTSQGLMSSMVNMGSMLALLGTLLMQGRIGKVIMLLLSTALQAVALALCGTTQIFPLFCIACMVLGVGSGLTDTYANSILVDVHKNDSARYLGYLHGLFGVGSLLAPLLIQQMMYRVGWRGAFFIMAATLGVGTIALVLANHKITPSSVAQNTKENVLGWQDLLEYAKNPHNVAILFATVFATATQTGILVWVLRYMTLRFNAESLGAISISVYWICATINRFSVSHIPIQPLRLFVGGALLTALCLGLGVLSGSRRGMCVAMGAMGLFSGHFMQVLFSECTRGYAGKTTFATSILMVVIGLARSVVPLAMAYASASLSVSVSMLIPAGTAIAAAIAGLFVSRMSIHIDTAN